MKHIKIHSTFIFLFIICQTIVLPVNGQFSGEGNEKAFSLEIGFASATMLGESFPGMAGHYLFFYTDRLGTGLSILTVQNQVTQNFGFPVNNPQLMMGEYGWINQFLLINNKYVKFAINLTNGLMQASLTDDSQVSNLGVTVTSTNLDRNYYYFLEPGAALSLRLFGSLYLTGGINYRYLYGKSNFSSRKDFEGTDLNLGLSMINNRK